MLNSRKSSTNRFAEAAAWKRRRVHLDQHDPVLATDYPCRLNLYLCPPPPDITIEEFELFALDRLQVLKTLEVGKLRNRPNEEYNKDIQQALDMHLPLHSDGDQIMEERRKDHISHFVLRLVYCQTEESRRWFLQQEHALFKYRFEQESTEGKRRFLKMANLDWKVVDADAKKRLSPFLEKCACLEMEKTAVASYVANETYYELDFEKVPDLVGNRQAYLHKGKIYVPMVHQTSLVMDEFKTRLSRMLEATAQSLPRLENDDRLKPILMNVQKQYSGNMYTRLMGTAGDLKASEVAVMVEHHAPLCMKTLQDALRRDKHLKYGGRMQYGLFLKAIGLSIEEALLFWRTAFANKTDEQFQKEYAYNIRHNYGLEGKRVDYSAYSCSKIIKSNGPSTGDYHGCPFRHFSSGSLEARLHKDKIPSSDVKKIVDLVRGSYYQVACTKYFELTHPHHQKIDIIEHPNSYYELSLEDAEG